MELDRAEVPAVLRKSKQEVEPAESTESDLQTEELRAAVATIKKWA